MKKSAIAAIAAAAVLVVGGGTAYALSTNGQAATAPALIEATATTTPTATESAAPLVAETPAPPAAGENAEDAFLIEARSRLAKIRTQIPNATDAQLLEAAHHACEALAPDLTGEDLSLIDGETRTNGHYMDSSAIIISARLTMCPIEG